MACGGDVHAGGGRGLRQNAHHHELGGTENERARSQCKQTLLHGSSNYFSITYKTVRQSIDSSDILRWSANKYGGLP